MIFTVLGEKSMTKLVLIRHGESLGNAELVFLGHTDWDLTETGYKQAELTADFLDDMKIDVIYSSDLKRAYNTALPIAKRRNMEIITSKELREIYAGKWEGMKFIDIKETYPENHTRWMTDVGNAFCDGGETVFELQQRVKNELDRIARENEGKTVCIATHATPIRTMLCIWNGLPISEAKNFGWVKNASVTIINYNDDGTYSIVLEAESAHLRDVPSVELKNI